VLLLSGANQTCVWWSTTSLTWETSGCTLESSTASVTTCHCTHLTDFSVLFSISTASPPQTLTPTPSLFPNPPAPETDNSNQTAGPDGGVVAAVVIVVLIAVGAAAVGGFLYYRRWKRLDESKRRLRSEMVVLRTETVQSESTSQPKETDKWTSGSKPREVTNT